MDFSKTGHTCSAICFVLKQKPLAVDFTRVNSNGTKKNSKKKAKYSFFIKIYFNHVIT